MRSIDSIVEFERKGKKYQGKIVRIGKKCYMIDVGEKFLKRVHFKDVCESSGEIISNVKPSRKKCETPATEILPILKILYPRDTKNKESIMKTKEKIKHNPKFKCNGNIDDYYKDIESRSEKYIQEYLNNLDISKFRKKDIKFIYLTGKCFKNYPALVKLNTNIETKKLYDQKLTKSDIYIEFIDNSIIGISIKSKKSDFLTNYSIEKIFTEINIDHDLKNIRIDMVLNKFKKKIYPKSRREEANEMFYNKDNKYYSKINNILKDSDNMKKFINIMKKYLFPKLPYTVYGYNGLKLSNLNSLTDKNNNMNIKRNKNYETDTSAKLWYSIYINDVEKYKFDVRPKQGQISNGSLQIMTVKV